ncbi:protein Shroom2 [Lampris incognitus]|uniref:protein Shroom2 n=1 Tax=Lampris incognitus TaxID=2546036 RepID=UPI0024B5BF7E|nr:protein Shroom2 [Lampris incognitus]
MPEPCLRDEQNLKWTPLHLLVEEGSKAAAVSLQVGDELVNINEVPLSGYRQEAICLVKGSHKTLTLVVKRRNEPISRPHSWHSTKFNGSQSETAKTQSPPTPVWHTRYDASSSSTDLSTGWEQTNLRRVSDQFSSLGSMDSLEHVSHPYPPGQLSSAKSNNSAEHLGGGKRDSAYSSFSTSSGTPDYTLSKSNAASTENMLYKINQWDLGGKHSNGRNSQNFSDGAKLDDRQGYLQMAGGSTGRDSPRSEEQAGSRHSSSSRASFGPVWHVPEKKKTASPSPPPPPPPVRSDSFAATKVHERGLAIAYPEGPDSHVQFKSHEKEIEKRSETSDIAKRTSENHRSHVLAYKNDSDNTYILPDNSNHNPVNSNKQYSVSSTDVRLSHHPHASQPYHQRQYNDKSTFYSQPKTTSTTKPQNISGYYSSMQELSTNSSAHPYGQNHGKTPSLSSTAIDQNPDSGGLSRYYCVTTCQATQPNPSHLSGKAEDRKSAADIEVVHTGNDKNSLCSQIVNKAKYELPQHQQHISHSKDSNGYSKQDESVRHKQPPTVTPPSVQETSSTKPSTDERGNQRRPNLQSAEAHYLSYPPSKQSEQWRSLPLQQRDLLQDIRHQGQESSKICPQTSPMLHSLSMETTDKDEKLMATNCEESLESKQARRTDRFATTLRNEIQMRRAKLQKSKSAATLPGSETEAGTKTDQEVWKSKECSPPTSSDGSFTNTYKDNLKEAQARVLKATSFRRRDLEPVLLEYPVSEALPSYPSSVVARKDVTSLPTVSESLMNKSGSVSGQINRIGARKRFPPEKKVKSFSEPDKIHEVGVREDLPPTENTGSSEDQQKLFEATDKPLYPKHMPIQTLQNFSEDSRNIKPRVQASASETENKLKGIRTIVGPSTEYNEENQGVPYSAHKQSSLEQQRLGTFAEYEASWNVQKKPTETRASGRYRSADNILDPGAEERTKPTCFHERSRSSPSADFYGQKITVPGRKSAEYSQVECNPAEQHNMATRLSDRGPGECRVREKPVEPEHYLAPPLLPVTGPNPECRHRAVPAPVYHRPTSSSHSPTDSTLLHPEEHCHIEPRSDPRRKPPELEKPSPPKLDNSRRPEITPTPDNSHESFTRSQSEVSTHYSPNRDLDPAPVPAYSPKKNSEPSKGPVDRGQGAVRQAVTSSSEPASPSLASSYRPPVPVTMEEQRPPSPQFSPQKLSDKPPVSLQDEDSNRMENVLENNNIAVKKVPIKIVHSESISEKENRQYLLHNDITAAEAQGPGMAQLSSLGAPEHDYSVFCAYTRQTEPGSNRMPASQTDLKLQRNTDTSTLGDHFNSSVHQPSQPPEQVGNGNRVAPNTGFSEEDQKREELARDIMGKDRSLADILDQRRMKTTMDLMEGIFPQGEQLLEGAQQRRKVAPKQTVPRPTEERKEDASLAAAVAVVTSSTYYSTSAPKAELLIKMKDMQEQEEEDSEDELDIDLANKKQELIDSLSKKLQVLREARESLQEDILDNNALGEEVEATVQQVCKPNELDKFRMFAGDLDKVVSLLLSLSGRLARVENALNSLDEDATSEERRTLTEKRKLLIRQHEDAKELKENLDRRERVVYDILATYLREENLTDYEHFVKMKSALIIEQRKLEDKIKLGEEQLKCLTDSLPLEQRMPF